MTSRVAALALAASPLIALPAMADAPATTAQTALGGLSLSVGDAAFYVSVGHDRWRGRNGRHYRPNPWGQRPWEVRRLRRDALQRCAGAIQRQGYRIGFRDVDIDDDVRVRQIGPKGFRVRFDDVEFEGRRRAFDRDVSCTVRRGQVVDLDGLPRPGHRGYDRGRGHHDRWDRDDRYRGHDGRRRGGHRLYGGS
ncbi:hypothetical protein [Henriciella aquimarina]|uniref:hypothetical protein n=1 Tax=Henriciella aquimarina TaxID=545261 RepID=UPI00117AA87A|nr:hypothetical protein [Henriciella aquimarina]